MKKFNFLALCLLLFTTFSQAQTYQNATATDPADANNRAGGCGFNTQPGVQMSDITIPIEGTIQDPSKLTVNLSLSAEWLGDVVVELVAPSGEAITLIRRIGANMNSSCGDSSNFALENILGFNSSNTNPIDAISGSTTFNIPAGNYAPTYGLAKFPQHHPGDMQTFLNDKILNGNWRLILYDYGTGEPSTLHSWQIVIASGVLNTAEAGTFGSEMSLRQNPVEDDLLIDINSNFSSLEFEIYDMTGKLVKQENVAHNNTNINLDASDLSSGIYILKATKDGVKTQSIKFVKK